MNKLFISHASEDKAFVKELVKCLDIMKIGYWVDWQEIRSGDSIPQKINEGLSTCTCGILILSSNYLRETKFWTKEELWALINIESMSTHRSLIPIRLGIEHSQLTQLVPLLAHRLSIDFIDNPKGAAEEIALALTSNFKIVRPLSGEAISDNGLPSRHNVPSPRPFCEGFVGRESFVTSLLDQLASGRNSDFSHFGVLSLSGIPGTGKSTIACELTYRIGKQFLGGVFWFDARSAATLAVSTKAIEKLIRSTRKHSQWEENNEIHYDNVRHYFENTPCLIVFDALTQEITNSDLLQLLPKTGLSRVITTSRTEKLELPIRAIDAHVTQLDLNSSIAVLMQFRVIPESDTQLKLINNICHELGYLPLALQLAARYLRTHSLSFAEYLDRLIKRGPKWKGLASTIQTIPSVIEVLKQCVEDICSRGEVGELAMKILRRCAAIDLVHGRLCCWDESEIIRLFGLSPLCLASSVGINKDNESAVEQFDEAIELLEQVGLVRRSQDSGSNIWLHSLTLQFARDYLDTEDGQYLSVRLHIEWVNVQRMMNRSGWIDYFDDRYEPTKLAISEIKKLSQDAALDGFNTLYSMADFSDQKNAEIIADDAIEYARTLREDLNTNLRIMNFRIAKAYSVYKAKRLDEAENLYVQLYKDLEITAVQTDLLVDFLYYFGCLLLELGGNQRMNRAASIWDQAINLLIEEITSNEKIKLPPRLLFLLKLKLVRLFQAKAEKYLNAKQSDINVDMASVLSTELEPLLGNVNSWYRQLLSTRGPLYIKMKYHAVRRIPVI